MAEEWRAVAGYEGLYEVSDQGRVRSVDRTIVDRNGQERFHRGRVLKSAPTPRGGIAVALCRESKATTITVKKLVMDAFRSPSTPVSSVIGHRNGRQEDLRFLNLEYCY